MGLGSLRRLFSAAFARLSTPRKLLVGSLALGAAILVVVFSSDGAAMYSKRVSEVMRHTESWQGRRLRINGHLVSGSLVRIGDRSVLFRLTDTTPGPGKPELMVRYHSREQLDMLCDLPGELLSISVEGSLEGAGSTLLFQADKIMTKCPRAYRAGDNPCLRAPEAAARKCPICVHLLDSIASARARSPQSPPAPSR